MAFDNTPNRLESAFIQRDTANLYYEQINISGSDLVIYHDSTGKLTADKVLVWAALYGIGGGGNSESSSWASSSLQSQYSTQSLFATQSLFSTQSLHSTQSIYATQSLFSTRSLFSTQSLYSTQSLFSTQSLYATQSISASYSNTSSFVIFTSKTDNYLPKWSSNQLTATSSIYDDGTTVGIGTTTTSSGVNVITHTRLASSADVNGMRSITYFGDTSGTNNRNNNALLLESTLTTTASLTMDATSASMTPYSRPGIGGLKISSTFVSGSMVSLVGVGNQNLIRGGANISHSIGVLVMPITNDEGIISASNAYGLYVKTSTLQTSSSLTNVYGVYIQQSTVGTNKYGIYQSGSNTTNYFGGTITASAITSNLFGTASNSDTASYLLGSVTSASYAITASNVSGQSVCNQYAFSSGFSNYYTASISLTNSDNGKFVAISTASAATVTISSSLDTNFSCLVFQSGSGQVTIATGSTATILRNRQSQIKIAGQYGVVSLVRVPSGDFILSGDTGA